MSVKRNRIALGTLIRRFMGGKSRPSVFSAEDMNELVDTLNAFRRFRVTRGDVDKPILDENGFTLQLAADAGGGGGTAISQNVPVQITSVNSDSWNVVFPLILGSSLSGTSATVLKPFNLRCSVAHGNADIYDSSGVHSLLAADFTYDSTYLKRTVAVSGFQTETAYVQPMVQPLQTFLVTGTSGSAGNVTITTSPGIPSGALTVGMYVFFSDPTFGSPCRVIGTGTVSGGVYSNFRVDAAEFVTAGTVSWGGTTIYIAQDINGDWFDLNVDARAWSEVALIPNP